MHFLNCVGAGNSFCTSTSEHWYSRAHVRSRAKPFLALNEPSLAENAEKKVLNILAFTGADRQTDMRTSTPAGDSKMDGSTAAGDDSVAASEKSSDVGGERPDETAVQVPLRKTLSCSAKGILSSKLMESASGPVLPPGSPLSPCSQYPPMATSASQMLPRESTGPLLWRRTAFAAPVATPQQCPRGGLVVPVVRRGRESSPPCQVMAACPPSSHQPVHVAPAWSQHSVVRLVHPAQHQVLHAAPQLGTRPSVLVQYPIQPQAGCTGMVAVAEYLKHFDTGRL